MENTIAVRQKSGALGGLVKGVFVAMIISLLGILIFALIIKFVDVSTAIIQPVNQVIKFLSILIGVKTMYNKSNNRNLILSLLLGVIYTSLAMLCFNLLNGSMNFDMSFFTDAVFGGVAGLISGVITKILLKN